MCGIAGIFHFDADRKADERVVKKMVDCIIYRGPDGAGYFIKDHIGLGHRRLSIIDLTTGDQPMFSDDKSITIVYNGEIYNYLELREELKKLGHRFLTDSDTEVIIHAYLQWGEEFLKHLNGMWAIALWDDRKKQLLLSKDRLGEKPLFYGVYDNTFLFGSEIKCILSYGFPVSPRSEFTEFFLCTGYIPAPHTYYKDIFKLQPGHYLIVKEGKLTDHTYWDIPQIDESNMITDRKKVHETFSSLFFDSVKIRMRSDVPFGAFLSGGLDSSSVVAAMSEISSSAVQTFTIGFEDKAFDERNLANDVAKKFHTNHQDFVVEPESFDGSLQKVLHHYDEPFGDSSAIPTGYVSAIAARHVKMVLTGDGGDEVLSGYNAYQVEKFAERFQFFPSWMRKPILPFLSSLMRLSGGETRYRINRLSQALQLSALPFEERYRIKYGWYMPETIAMAAAPLGPQIKIVDFLDDFFRKYPAKDSFYKLMLLQLKHLLPDDFLVKVDRMSMANSLETRIPFLDYRLVEMMVKVHKDVKMEGYERKSILRKTIGRKLPDSILKGPKKGFSVPLREWFKDKAFEQRLETLYTTDYGLDKRVVKQLIDVNNKGKADLGNLIWILFILKGWTEKNCAVIPVHA